MIIFQVLILLITFEGISLRYDSKQRAYIGENTITDLYWNSSNPIFLLSNTEHVIDVNQGTHPLQYDRINFRCPFFVEKNRSMRAERLIIYNVNKEEYESCRLMSRKPRIMAYCNHPYQEKVFTISFRSFSPMPGSIEFHPGKDYYFISTSSYGNLHNKEGGFCLHSNMKVIVKVGNQHLLKDYKHASSDMHLKSEFEFIRRNSESERDALIKNTYSFC